MSARRDSRDGEIAFLEQDALRTREEVEKNSSSSPFPFRRSYTFCCAGDAAAQRHRFFRPLTEQLTPSGIAAETPAA